jgi:hypothetical protein
MLSYLNAWGKKGGKRDQRARSGRIGRKKKRTQAKKMPGTDGEKKKRQKSEDKKNGGLARRKER